MTQAADIVARLLEDDDFDPKEYAMDSPAPKWVIIRKLESNRDCYYAGKDSMTVYWSWHRHEAENFDTHEAADAVRTAISKYYAIKSLRLEPAGKIIEAEEEIDPKEYAMDTPVAWAVVEEIDGEIWYLRSDGRGYQKAGTIANVQDGTTAEEMAARWPTKEAADAYIKRISARGLMMLAGASGHSWRAVPVKPWVTEAEEEIDPKEYAMSLPSPWWAITKKRSDGVTVYFCGMRDNWPVWHTGTGWAIKFKTKTKAEEARSEFLRNFAQHDELNHYPIVQVPGTRDGRGLQEAEKTAAILLEDGMEDRAESDPPIKPALPEPPAEEDFDPKEYAMSLGEIFKDKTMHVFIPQTYAAYQQHCGVNKMQNAGVFEKAQKLGPVILCHATSPANVPGTGMHTAVSVLMPGSSSYYPPTGKSQNAFDPSHYPQGAKLAKVLQKYFLNEAKNSHDPKRQDDNLVWLIEFGGARLALPYEAELYSRDDDKPLKFSMIAKLAMAAQAAKKPVYWLTARIGSDVLLKNNGALLLYDDWDDTVHLFDQQHRKFAKEVFSGEMDAYSNLDFDKKNAANCLDEVNGDNLNRIKTLMIGLEIDKSDDLEDGPVTPEDAAEMDADDISKLVLNQESMEDILHALSSALYQAEASAIENAYYAGYRDAVEEALGGKHEWTTHGTGEKKTHSLGFFIPYSVIDERAGDGSGYDTLRDAAEDVQVSVSDNYQHNFDAEAFNEALSDNLAELDEQDPQPKDPKQTTMALDDPAGESPAMFTLFGPEYEQGKAFWLKPAVYNAYVEAYPQFKSKESYYAWKLQREDAARKRGEVNESKRKHKTSAARSARLPNHAGQSDGRGQRNAQDTALPCGGNPA